MNYRGPGDIDDVPPSSHLGQRPQPVLGDDHRFVEGRFQPGRAPGRGIDVAVECAGRASFRIASSEFPRLQGEAPRAGGSA